MVLKPVTAATTIPEDSWGSCQVSHRFIQLLPHLCLPLLPSQGTKGTSEFAQSTEMPFSLCVHLHWLPHQSRVLISVALNHLSDAIVVHSWYRQETTHRDCMREPTSPEAAPKLPTSTGGLHWLLLFRCQVTSDSFATPWTAARQAPLSMRFPRQEYWSGFPFPSPGDLPDPGIEPVSPACQVDSLTAEPRGKPFSWLRLSENCSPHCPKSWSP